LFGVKKRDSGATLPWCCYKCMDRGFGLKPRGEKVGKTRQWAEKGANGRNEATERKRHDGR